MRSYGLGGTVRVFKSPTLKLFFFPVCILACEFRENHHRENHALPKGVNKFLSLRDLHIMLLRILEFRENRPREGRTFLIDICTVKPSDILEVKNAMAKSVYYVTEHTICSLVITETGYVYCAVRTESSHAIQANRGP